MSFRSFMSDPMWQSFGAIISGVLVFIGAWYGTLLANREKDKERKVDLNDNKAAYEIVLNGEISNNKLVLEKISSYLMKNPPIESAFNAVLAGSAHLRYETWNTVVMEKVSTAFSSTQQIHYEVASSAVRKIARIISMEANDWKRVYYFNKYYRENPSEQLIQLPYPQDVLNQITQRLRNDIDDCLNDVNNVKKMIDSNWI